MITTTVTNWGDAFMTSLAGALALLAAAIPKIIGFVLILVIGWFVASLIAKAVAGLLRAVRFNEVAQRSGFSGFVKNTGVETDASGFLALVAKWFIRLIALIVAFDALGLPAVSDVLQQLLLWLPNLVVALVVLVLAGLAANAVSSLVKGAASQAGLSNPGLLASIARAAIWGFGIIVAVNQLGIAATLVNTLFIGLVGALALALGLAFGLGGREAAANAIATWQQQAEKAKPKLEQAAKAAQQQAQSQAPGGQRARVGFPMLLRVEGDGQGGATVDLSKRVDDAAQLERELKAITKLSDAQTRDLAEKLMSGERVSASTGEQPVSVYVEEA
jgi:hypothetical protein